MRVLLIHNDYKIPGGESTVFEAEKRLLVENGHHVCVFSKHNSEIDSYSLQEKVRLFQSTFWSHASYSELEDFIHQCKPDVAHFHNTLPLISPAAYYACGRNRVPVVQTLHNFRLMCPVATIFRDGQVCEDCHTSSLRESVKHACYRGSRVQTATVARMISKHRKLKTFEQRVNAYIALTPFHREKFVEAGLPEERIFVKPNFLYSPEKERKGTGKYALYLGRLSAEKGVDVLLRAWRELSLIHI